MHSPDARHRAAGHPRQPLDRDPQLRARHRARRQRRRQRGQGRHGRELAQLLGLGRRGERPLHAERLQRHLADHARAEHELLGHEEALLLERRRAQHDRPDPAAERRPRLARDRDRPLGRPGGDAQEQQERERLAAAVDLDLLPDGERQPQGLGGDLERQATRTAIRYGARLRLAGQPRRSGRDPGSGPHPVDVPRRPAPERRDQDRPRPRPRRHSPPRATRASRSRSSTPTT